MQKRTSTKTKENAFKGTVNEYMKTGIKNSYKRGDVATYARSLIKKHADGDLQANDKEIAAMVVAKFGGATSVKAIQWYRHKMREEGILEPAKPRAARRYASELSYEVIDPDGEIEVLSAKKLITYARKALIRDGGDRQIAQESIYSVPTAVAFLTNLGMEVVDQNNYEQMFENN